MDVIAIRKRSGTITGSILMNGWPQETVSFRRCSGYVYQFDVQSPELTVRETILFSARLRLDSDLVTNDDEIHSFVDQVMVRIIEFLNPFNENCFGLTIHPFAARHKSNC
jgi:ABC-type multidrug transport system ATPase subunit